MERTKDPIVTLVEEVYFVRRTKDQSLGLTDNGIERIVQYVEEQKTLGEKNKAGR